MSAAIDSISDLTISLVDIHIYVYVNTKYTFVYAHTIG